MALKAIISGGGIGGLATAIALAQRGWDVTVYELRPNLAVSGSGIYLSSNGLAVLEELSACQHAVETAFRGRGIEQRDHEGRAFLPPRLAPGSTLVSIPRKNLLSGLEAAARASSVKIVTNALVVDALANGTLILANGDQARADLAVGCDGVWSPVRKGLGLEEYHVRTPEGALRTIVAGTQEEMPEDARDRCIENWNGMRRLLITPINDREVYLALTCPSDDLEGKDTSIRPCWGETFPQWAWLLDRIGSEVSWSVYSIIRSKRWSAGHTAIVGDAAHAQPPNLGQGGGTAMQNGLALAAYMAKISDPRDIPAALEAWENTMRPLIEKCQNWSVMFGEIANIPDHIRSHFMQAAFSNEWVQEGISVAATSAPITEVDWSPS